MKLVNKKTGCGDCPALGRHSCDLDFNTKSQEECITGTNIDHNVIYPTEPCPAPRSYKRFMEIYNKTMNNSTFTTPSTGREE